MSACSPFAMTDSHSGSLSDPVRTTQLDIAGDLLALLRDTTTEPRPDTQLEALTLAVAALAVAVIQPSEVPRGTLFHHYAIDDAGRVVAADVVTPTAQNYGNLEDQFRATVRDGAGQPDDELRRRLEMVARAYDPCVSCSVHTIRTA